MDLNNPRTAFNPIPIPNTSPAHNLLEQECKRILTSSEKVELTHPDQRFPHLPYLLRLLFGIHHALASQLPASEVSLENMFSVNTSSPLLKCSLLKQLAGLMEKRQFLCGDSQKVYEQVGYCLVLKPSLFPYLLAILSQNTNLVSLDKLLGFFSCLLSEQFALLLPLHVYHLFGGGAFTIEARVFREKLGALLEALGRALSTSDTVINRNIEEFKSSKQRQIILQESLRTVMLAKNREGITEAVTRISGNIFGSREYMQRQEFLQAIQGRAMEPTLSIFILLARSQAQLFEERSFRASLQLRGEITQANFYASEMTKLFNKCPFNGDERCNCKKCQCVRRNRESAKLSQEKKRNAVEQVEALKKRIEELTERDRMQEKRMQQLEQKTKAQSKRNVELQEQNLMLRTLLKEMKANPNIKQLMMQTIEPVSKILNNEF